MSRKNTIISAFTILFLFVWSKSLILELEAQSQIYSPSITATTSVPVMIISINANAIGVPDPLNGNIILNAISTAQRVDYYINSTFLSSASPRVSSSPFVQLPSGVYFFGLMWKPLNNNTVTVTAYACSNPIRNPKDNPLVPPSDKLSASVLYNVMPRIVKP